MSDEPVGQGLPKPYHPPVIDDLGSLRELTAGGGRFGNNYDGVAYSTNVPPPAPGS